MLSLPRKPLLRSAGLWGWSERRIELLLRAAVPLSLDVLARSSTNTLKGDSPGSGDEVVVSGTAMAVVLVEVLYQHVS